MKVTIIGGGSTYTPELISGFLTRADQFPLTELCLMDIDSKRLDIVGEFAQRIVEVNGAPFEVTLNTDLRSAIQGAAYVITLLRVGHMAARREDEYLGKRHGLIGQETTGVGGMAKALRTIPVILEVANTMRELAPGAMLANFTNPAGLITQALSQYAADVPSVGVCNVPITAKMMILETLEKQTGVKIPPENAQLQTLGLNHLSWHRGFIVNGEDIWPQVMESFLSELKEADEPEWDISTIEALGMIPNYYLEYYYYTKYKLSIQQQWPPSRAEEVIEIEKDLLGLYANPALDTPPPELIERGGAYYSTVATQLLNAHYNDLDEIHVVNTVNNGAVSAWPDEWVLEIPSRVSREGILPIATEPLPPVCAGLIAQVKSYELLTVEAAVHGDRKAAYQALLAHPLGPAADQIQAVLDDMLETHKTYLPQF